MAQPSGEDESDALRLDFDHRLKLKLHGSSVTSDADRPGRDRAMRWIVVGRVVVRGGLDQQDGAVRDRVARQ